MRVIVRVLALAVPVAAGQQVFYADVGHFFDVGRNISFSMLPYRDFLWDFPPLTAVSLGVIPLTGRSEVVFAGLFVATMVTLEVLALRRLRQLSGEQAGIVEWFWLVAVVPMGAVAYFRFDFLAAFLATLSIVALFDVSHKGWSIVAGAATTAWTLVFCVPLLLQRRYGPLVLVALGAAAVLGLWYVFSPEGFADFLRYRQGDGFQIESLPGALLLLFGRESALQFGAWTVPDDGWAALQWLMPAVFVVAALGLTVWGWRRPLDLVALCATLTLLLILTSRVLSPQYLVWMAPFCALLFPKYRIQGYLLAAASYLTLVELAFYGALLRGQIAPALIVNLRNAVLVVLLGAVVWVMAQGPASLREGR